MENIFKYANVLGIHIDGKPPNAKIVVILKYPAYDPSGIKVLFSNKFPLKYMLPLKQPPLMNSCTFSRAYRFHQVSCALFVGLIGVANE